MKLVGTFTESNQTIDVPNLASYSEIILAGYSEYYGLYGSEVFDIPSILNSTLKMVTFTHISVVDDNYIGIAIQIEGNTIKSNSFTLSNGWVSALNGIRVYVK